MATYQYIKAYNTLNDSQLLAECVAAGLPATDVQRFGDAAQTMQVVTSRDLTAPEVTTLDGLVAAHDGRPRRKRTVFAIYTDLAALTATQRDAVWADLMGGNPPKLALDTGPNTADVFTMHFLSTAVSGLTAAEKNEAKRRTIAFYVQDNPAYLVNPPFAPAVNTPGDEPFTP